MFSVVNPVNKVLLIHASLGAGHRRAAQALQEVFQSRGVESEVQDLLTFLPGPLSSGYPWAYNFMIQDARRLWKSFYTMMNRPSTPYAPARSMLQRWQFTRLKRYLQSKTFTHIISTHFTPSALLTDWKTGSQIDAKIFSVVTDHIAHRCWKRTGLDHYFVTTSEVETQLIACGIPKDKITVSGIPVSSAFSVPRDRAGARAAWSCAPKDVVVLVLCSGISLEKTVNLLTELRDIQPQLRLLISTGSDPAKEEKVRSMFPDPNFTVFGFSTRIAEMMQAVDFILTKPGGLIVSEALAMGLPQLLFSPIPGQEEANADHAVRHGAAILIEEKKGAFADAIRDLLSYPQKLSAMADSARALGKPDAAIVIVNQVLRA